MIENSYDIKRANSLFYSVRNLSDAVCYNKTLKMKSMRIAFEEVKRLHVIYVDAEKTEWKHFQQTAEKYKEITSFQLFLSAKEALEWIESNPVDVAFLETEIGEEKGIELARQLKEFNPNICVVFVTAHAQYALEAFGIDAIGYVLKPYSEESIAKELKKVSKMSPSKMKRVEIKTFPNFQVKVDGEVLRISNAKSKELFALLVERMGAGLTSGEAISYLWPNRINDSSTQTLYRMTLKRLMDTLRAVNAEGIIDSSGREKYIRTELVDCDLYKVLDGDKEAARYYTGAFMKEYSWAEERNAQLYYILEMDR